MSSSGWTNAEVQSLLHIFYSVEIIYNTFGILVTLIFFGIFLRYFFSINKQIIINKNFRTPVYHVNLRWVLGSFCLCFALTSVVRIFYCEFSVKNNPTGILVFASDYDVTDVTFTMGSIRDTCMLAGRIFYSNV